MSIKLISVILSTITILILSGCATSNGANVLLLDFNKYDRNYAPFKTQHLGIGESKRDIVQAMGPMYQAVEAGQGYEVLAYQQWVAVAGPDYVGKTLYLKFDDSVLSAWKINSDTMAIVPRSW